MSEKVMTGKIDRKVNQKIRSGNRNFRVKDPGSALTHFIGFAAAIFATPLLLIQASTQDASGRSMVSLSIFLLSMILLYGASTAYHSFDISERGNVILRKLDHTMIYLLIAGTYTPICVIGIGGSTGTWLLAIVWGFAVVGTVMKLCWITCPKWVSSAIYIAMGWICLLALPKIWESLDRGAFWWLLAGGIIYTIGGVIYALKIPVFDGKFPNFGMHEIFHIFVMGGTFCHFIVMYRYIALMG